MAFHSRLNFSFCLAGLILGLWSGVTVRAELRVAGIFDDHMVLQREMPIRIWGEGDPSRAVVVRFGDAQVSAESDGKGKWSATLPAVAASAEGKTLRVAQGDSVKEFKDVLVGDVWLCSGQSNMEFTVARSEHPGAAKPNPLIRHFGVNRRSFYEKQGIVGSWHVAEGAFIQKFTATGFFFASELQPAVGVPIGLVNSTWGGTRIESWLSEATLRNEPCLVTARERWEKSLPAYAAAFEKYQKELAQWPGAPAPKPKEPVPPSLSAAMIAPLSQLAIKGVLWYQGEANASNPEEYRALFAALVSEWREGWNNPVLPFVTVQLPAFGVPWDKTGCMWAFFREVQEQARKIPGVFMAVTLDLGDDADIHPVRKMEVGRRLSAIARTEIYRDVATAYGPRLRDWQIAGSDVVLIFDQPIEVADAAMLPKGFELAGENKQFLPARAVIDGNRVTVRAEGLAAPLEVRYAWSNRHTGNLTSETRLPMESFRTDTWPRY